ncbi:DegT/DnrJ/EryC1/StrS family aminotransferase [Prolixibacteraceae bacterium JC049]|nr:DegT/DnrJ/EryC1/StrS family aminotransferase [Prolixibacteraceae bacterium JC049]
MVRFWNYIDELKKEEEKTLSAIKDVLYSGRLILGENVERFETNFSNYCNAKQGIGVANGTDALFLALKALGVEEGDEVITVANTAVPTVSAIVSAGARPVFVDINPKTMLMDGNKVESAITEKTKCILPVHLYGQCADMEALKGIAEKHNLRILEDCAQAHGASRNGCKAGGMGDASAFSFYPTKVLGTYGDGGLVCTSDDEVAQKMKELRFYGMRETYYSEGHGYNSRLDELHAAILLVKFDNIEDYLKRRREIAKRYMEAFADLDLQLPYVDNGNEHVYYQFVCRHPKRDEVVAALKEQGIGIAITYPYPIHTMRGYQYLGYKEGDLPETEVAANEVFSLPLYVTMPDSDVEKVIDAVRKVLA